MDRSLWSMKRAEFPNTGLLTRCAAKPDFTVYPAKDGTLLPGLHVPVIWLWQTTPPGPIAIAQCMQGWLV